MGYNIEIYLSHCIISYLLISSSYNSSSYWYNQSIQSPLSHPPHPIGDNPHPLFLPWATTACAPMQIGQLLWLKIRTSLKPVITMSTRMRNTITTTKTMIYPTAYNSSWKTSIFVVIIFLWSIMSLARVCRGGGVGGNMMATDEMNAMRLLSYLQPLLVLYPPLIVGLSHSCSHLWSFWYLSSSSWLF